jgi:hypothetical protein
MPHIRYITLTGAGEKTSFSRMRALSREFPFTEWAVLYSHERAGRDSRHPPLTWLEQFADKARAAQMNTALHLCGSAIRTALGAMARTPRERTASEKELLALCARYRRVQLNVLGKVADVKLYLQFAHEMSQSTAGTRVVLPYYKAHAGLVQLTARSQNFDILYDSADEPDEHGSFWPALGDKGFTRPGFTQAPGSTDLGSTLDSALAACPERTFWVYLEGELLDKRIQFSLSNCHRALAQAQAWEDGRRKALEQQHPAGRVLVNRLDGFWLDWWTGAALAVPGLVVPPLDATVARRLCRHLGTLEPVERAHHRQGVENALWLGGVELRPRMRGWEAWLGGKPLVRAEDLDTVCARAAVALRFGLSVPRRPVRG